MRDLSEREEQITRYLAAGYNRDDIAQRLHLQRSTVSTTIMNACRRVGVKGQMQLIVWWHRESLREELDAAYMKGLRAGLEIKRVEDRE